MFTDSFGVEALSKIFFISERLSVFDGLGSSWCWRRTRAKSRPWSWQTR